MKWTQSTYTAIQYGMELTKHSPSWMYHYFYGYNRLPFTASDHFLWSGTPMIKMPPSFTYGQDDYWNYLTENNSATFINDQWIYKLYLPLSLTSFEKQLPRIVDILIQEKAFGCKWPIHRNSCLRPDRFLAYFKDKNALFSAAATILNQLTETIQEEVPFTSYFPESTKLSYGIDPPGSAEMGVSWRSHICRLAANDILKLPIDKSPHVLLSNILSRFKNQFQYEIQ